MTQNLNGSGLYDESVIDDRNQRPLTIAFATIVTVWLAFGIVSVSAKQCHHVAESAASVAASVEKQ
jgi:hypothetical protein